MKDKEKVMAGLMWCSQCTNEEPFKGCEKCPYNEVSISMQECRSVLCDDAFDVILVQDSVEYALTVLRRNGWKETEK